ncbi:type II toxin-antitoxin system RelE/ParE family toxin [Streptomyces sp. RG38]|uniref:Type II toxin-antitoxin system RelE/ParE family toxin n=1 Tax=Streptomyces tagetis TaxID=2820809 RepID=A0A940XKH9_9ACTN|nr:type II toxin-antitoxin system RelE/ParE family toxin [Streptomyces sp. RG38]
MSEATYNVAWVDGLLTIELEPEMRDWLDALPARHFLKIDEYVGLLAEHAGVLGEPYARYLGDGVRELRPTLNGAAIRITYWLTPNRTAVLLTVFRKTRMREDAEVRRAKLAQKVCEAEHGPAHEEFVRTIEEGEVEQ